MAATPSPRAYSKVQIGLHWLIALLIGLNYIFSESIEEAFRAVMSGAPVPEGAPGLHAPIGIAVLVLTLIRLVVRRVQGVPPPLVSDKPLMDKLGQWAHSALYGLAILVPLLGMMAWGGGIGIAGGAHGLAVNLLVAIAFVHAAAAIFHQYVLRDGMLNRITRGN
ncbi:cytochrome b [Rhodobacter ferrooxidans]|uniref:Cytochrome B561 n=1 Tax=Rhodobacter ferrooxidans TaxID=371731 RepID=C8S311_9RHOB|nr:cytochrome b/b6 domain-containing protein [Rhodobacter sp. SW2]EEW24651.1 cytochrome B561 [Rhodobacter sp. SW2]